MPLKGFYLKIKKGIKHPKRGCLPVGTRSKVREEHTKTTEKLDTGFSQLFGLIDDTLEQMKRSPEKDPNGHEY